MWLKVMDLMSLSASGVMRFPELKKYHVILVFYALTFGASRVYRRPKFQGIVWILKD